MAVLSRNLAPSNFHQLTFSGAVKLLENWDRVLLICELGVSHTYCLVHCKHLVSVYGMGRSNGSTWGLDNCNYSLVGAVMSGGIMEAPRGLGVGDGSARMVFLNSGLMVLPRIQRKDLFFHIRLLDIYSFLLHFLRILHAERSSGVTPSRPLPAEQRGGRW